MTAVDDVKQKTDVVDVIGQYVTLRKAGRNFKALCPFHNEKTPSFIVFPDQGTWHCFGSCNTGGDVFTFLMRKENIDFGEALRRLAQRAGVELTREVEGEDADRKRLRQLLAEAASHYHYLLNHSPAARGAREYVGKRNILPETAALFELGYAPNEWEALKSYLTAKGHSLRDMEAAGLVSHGERNSFFDRFRGRLMFPIRNKSGEVIGFGARTLSGEEPKYLNSPQTVLFDKSSTLYGLDLAKDEIRAQNLAVIVEGYMDVIGAHQGGFRNVVASLGTALTERQLGLLKRLTKRYALALDPDAAGEEATKRGLQVAREALDRKTVPVPMSAGLIVFEDRLEAELLVIPMPEGKDPDELIHEDPERWRQLVQSAEPLVDFFFRTMTRDLDLKAPRDKSTAVKRLAPIIREIPDPVQQTHYIQQLARMIQAPEQTVAREISRRQAETGPQKGPKPPEQQLATPAVVPPIEEYLMTLLANTPDLVKRVGFLDPEELSSPSYRILLASIRQSADQGIQDRTKFRDELDSSLVPSYDHLIELGKLVGELNEPDLLKEAEKAAYSIQLQHDRRELADIEVLLRDNDPDRSNEETRQWQERVAFLGTRLIANQKALDARRLLRTRSFDKTGIV